jgi:hypothetical protein
MQLLQVDVIFNWMEPFILEAFIIFVDERTSKSIKKTNQSQSKAKNIGLGKCHLSS